MKIQQKQIPNSNIVILSFGHTLEKDTLTGSIELDIENQHQFVDHINTTLDNGETNIILLMDNITYIDSSGLWALFESQKKTENRNGKMILLRPKKDVKRVLDITKISSKIKIFEKEKSAIQYFKNL